jgi:hypothetical protein
MIVNFKDRWGYVGINKNGSTSLHDYLQQSPFNGVDPDPSDQHKIDLPPGADDGWTVLLVVRNPFDRALSLWRHATYNDFPEATFKQFLLYTLECPEPFYSSHQTEFLRPWRRLSIARLESLQADLSSFYGFDVPPIPQLNTTDSRALRDHYTPELIRLVRMIYHDDFEAFGYPLEFDA